MVSTAAHPQRATESPITEDTPVILDVRERDEFDAGHVPGAVHLPLSTFESAAPGLLAQLAGRPIVFMCRSGNRARQAYDSALARDLVDPSASTVYDGGLLRWQAEGRPVRGAERAPLPVLRQVQITAGTGVAAFAALGVLVHPAYTVAAGLVGAGLLLAGATGNCAMATLLAKAPWNRRRAGGARCEAGA